MLPRPTARATVTPAAKRTVTPTAATAPRHARTTPPRGRTDMRIGLTYDLRDAYLAMGYGEEETAEFDRESTIAAIEGTLRSLGHDTDRIGHAKQLATRLVRGDRWDLVFNIAEGMHGIGREAQVPALLDVYEVPYTFSDP